MIEIWSLRWSTRFEESLCLHVSNVRHVKHCRTCRVSPAYLAYSLLSRRKKREETPPIPTDNQGILPARETSFFHQGYFLTPPPQLLTRQKPSSRWKLGGKRGSAIYFYNRSFLRCFSSDTERIDSICSIESEREKEEKGRNSRCYVSCVGFVIGRRRIYGWRWWRRTCFLDEVEWDELRLLTQEIQFRATKMREKELSVV